MARRKRSYRSVKVKNVDRERLSKEVAGKRIVFSIDAAKEKLYGSFMGEDRKVKVTVRWDLCEESRTVVKLLQEMQASKVEVVLEPTGTYGDPVRHLMEQAGFEVFQVSPKRSHDAAEVWDGVPSLHDAKSAEIIGRLHLDGVSQRWEDRNEDERGMVAEIARIEAHHDTYCRRINQIEAQLARHWPELTRVLDLTGATILALLAETGGPRAVRERPEEARALMARIGGSLLSKAKIEAAVRSARETIGKPMTIAEEELLKDLAMEASRSRELERKSRIQAEKQVLMDEESRAVGAVVGKGTAAVIKAQLGSLNRYDNAASVEKALGLNLKVKSSGKYKGQLRITKRGPSLSRKYMYMAVLRLIQTDSVLAAWYHMKVSRNGGIKGKALIAVMRKVARALWYVARGAKFDSKELVNVELLKKRA